MVALASGNTDNDYMKSNKDQTHGLTTHLKQNIATEATVSAVGWILQSNWENRRKLTRKLVEKVSQLQSCLTYLGTTSTIALADCCESSECEECTELQSLCRECETVSKVSHLPCLRACSKCQHDDYSGTDSGGSESNDDGTDEVTAFNMVMPTRAGRERVLTSRMRDFL